MADSERSTKFCGRCQRDLDRSLFGLCRRKRDGLQSNCKQCKAARAKQRYVSNRDVCLSSARRWKHANRERVQQYRREWYEAHRGREIANSLRYARENTDRVRAGNRRWRNDHRAHVNAYNGRWRTENRGRWLAGAGRYRAANKDNVRASVRKSQAKYPERARERKQKWARSNPERYNATKRAAYHRNLEQSQRRALRGSQARRARLLGAFVEHVDPKTVYDRDQGICGICGQPVGPSVASIDHIVPLAKGGKHSYRNVQLAHLSCNLRKGARCS